MRLIVSTLFVVVVFRGSAHAQPGPSSQPDRSAQPDPSSQPDPSPQLDPAAQPRADQPYAGQPPGQPYVGQPYPGQPYPGQPYPGPPGQPYPGQPYPSPYPGQPYPPPGAVSPYPLVPVSLSPDDQALLSKGEISDGRHTGGIITSLFFGLGIGQAVQGRYGDTGWIFTIGEIGSMVALISGAVKSVDCSFDYESRCQDNSAGDALLIGGAIGLVVFRIWEIADAIGGPPKHNARVRELRLRLGMPPTLSRRLRPYVAPPLSHDGGATAGVAIRF